MSWAEIKKSVNSDLNIPLNKAIGEIYNGDGEKLYPEHIYKTVSRPMLATGAHSNGGGAVVFDNAIHYFGGSQSTVSYNSHCSYDHGVIKRGADLPYNFTNGASVVWNNEIHIFGGNNSSSVIYNSRHSIYNGSLWENIGKAPWNISANAKAVVYNNKIHILDGANHYTWDGYNFTSVETLPTAARVFTASCVVVWNNEIHVLGGTNNPTGHAKWDGSSWTTGVSTIPYNFTYGSAVVWNNEIHILGTQSADYNSHYKWDGNEWSSVSTLPYDFYLGYAVVYENEIHILSGPSRPQAHYVFKNNSWIDTYDVLYKDHSTLNDGNHKYILNNDGNIVKVQRGVATFNSTISIDPVAEEKSFVIVEPTTNYTQIKFINNGAFNVTSSSSGQMTWQVVSFS